jgi:hypothetical protein
MTADGSWRSGRSNGSVLSIGSRGSVLSIQTDGGVLGRRTDGPPNRFLSTPVTVVLAGVAVWWAVREARR